MKHTLPCQHEGGTGEYHPLSRDEISSLLLIASQSDDAIECADIQCRLTQGIRGITCPHPIEGDAARRMNELDTLYVNTLVANPQELPAMVERFYQIMQGEIE